MQNTLILLSFTPDFHIFEKDHPVPFVLCICILQGIFFLKGAVLYQEESKWVKHEKLRSLQREEGLGLGWNLINTWEGEVAWYPMLSSEYHIIFNKLVLIHKALCDLGMTFLKHNLIFSCWQDEAIHSRGQSGQLIAEPCAISLLKFCFMLPHHGTVCHWNQLSKGKRGA